MKVKKVTPNELKLGHRSWKGCVYKGPLIVRAENKEEAIQLLNSKFQLAVMKISLGSKVIYCPWRNKDLVGWFEINHSTYPKEGKRE